MSRLLFFLLLGLAVYLLLTRGRRRGAAPPPRSETRAESMVACARCGLHLPLSESLEAGGRRYCCREHARRDDGNPS